MLCKDARALAGWQIAQAHLDVTSGDPAAFAQEGEGEAPEHAAKRLLQAKRQQHDQPHSGVAEPSNGVA